VTDGEANPEPRKDPAPIPGIYRNQGPRAQDIKALIQMIIGAFAAIFILTMTLYLIVRRQPGVIIQQHIFTAIGVALAAGAGIELAYTLFTHGPDEALDPLMLGLSATIVLQLAKVSGFDLKQAISTIVYVAALAGTFATRKYLAEDINVGDANWTGPKRRLGRLQNIFKRQKPPTNPALKIDVTPM
jgi:hypothetical protein